MSCLQNISLCSFSLFTCISSRNAQRLCAEIAAEEETKRKAAAKKRAKRKKKRAAKKCNDDEDKGIKQ